MKKWILILAAFAIFTIAKDEDIRATLFGTQMAGDIVADDSPVSDKWEKGPGFHAKKLHVPDGDGLVAQGNKFRLWCIDAPEKPDQPHSNEATAALEELVKNGAYIGTNGKDKYDRTLAVVVVKIDGKKVIVNYEMIRQGHAWVYRQHKGGHCGLDEEALYAMEKQAREEKRGLWQSPNPIYPGKWKYDNRNK